MERFSGLPEPSASRLRASDAERDEALRALATHFAEGRLDQAEFDRRSDAALAARLREDLGRLFTDLPALEPAGAAVRAGAGPGRGPGGPWAARWPEHLRWLPPPPIVAVLLAAFLLIAVTEVVHGYPPFPLFGVIFILARRRRRWNREARPWM